MPGSPAFTQVFHRGIAVLALIFAGCATTVTLQVQRPPALNTLGIQRLAVMPFSTAENSSLQRQAAAFLTNESLSRIQATNQFTLVNSSEIERVRSVRGNIETIADALFSGQVVTAGSQDTSSQSSYRDTRTGNTVYYTTYKREVQVAFNYYLTRTRDGSMIGPVSRNLSTSSSSQNMKDLPSAESMIQGLIQNSLAGLSRDVAPYMATERRSFMNVTSSDRTVKQRADAADALVKAGNYRNAQEAFLQLYQDTGIFAAAYNAGILIEVLGDLEGAAAFMQRVYSDTGNPKAAEEVSRLRRATADAGLFRVYQQGNLNQRDRVIALMVDTLPTRLPERARVALVNNTQNERDLAEAVINGIIEGFLSKNIMVIDRNNQALMEMERTYQISGNVRDEDIVSIGNEAGVNIFIMVSVTGSGAARRLSVRMLDVERSTVIYQSPQSDEMNL